MDDNSRNRLTLARRFLEPSNSTHRQYESLRAFFVDGLPSAEAAARFGYTPGSFRVLVHQFRNQPNRGLARKNDNATAKSRIRMMGLWNCASRRVRTRLPHTGLCSEGVPLESLCLAPSADSPSGVAWRWSSRSSKVTDQNVVRLWSEAVLTLIAFLSRGR